MPNSRQLRTRADPLDLLRSQRDHLRSISRPGRTVCGEAATGREALTLAKQYQPDIVVMDITMPELNGLEATRRIRKVLPATDVVVLSLHYSDELVREVVSAGARAYVLKSDASKDLVSAVKSLSDHRPYFTSSASEVLVKGFVELDSLKNTPISTHKALTSREREIVQLLAEGKSSKEVAGTLDICVKTAQTHRSNIMRKLGIHTVSEVVRFAVKHHMIEP